MLENSRAGLARQINKDRSYRPDEVAAIFRCDRRTVYRWIEKGYLGCAEGPSGYLKRIPGQVILEMVERMPAP
jgi:predicted site-specific integrase-resolvase